MTCCDCKRADPPCGFQLRKDRPRDLLAAGFPVVRFTGSEIFKDANDCVQQLREALFSPMERVAKAAGLLK